MKGTAGVTYIAEYSEIMDAPELNVNQGAYREHRVGRWKEEPKKPRWSGRGDCSKFSSSI